MRTGGWFQGDRGGLTFEAKTSQKPFEKRGGVIRGLEGLQVGLEVLRKSLRGVMGCKGVLRG